MLVLLAHAERPSLLRSRSRVTSLIYLTPSPGDKAKCRCWSKVQAPISTSFALSPHPAGTLLPRCKLKISASLVHLHLYKRYQQKFTLQWALENDAWSPSVYSKHNAKIWKSSQCSHMFSLVPLLSEGLKKANIPRTMPVLQSKRCKSHRALVLAASLAKELSQASYPLKG